MKITQIKDLVNNTIKQVDGSSPLLKDDLSNVVDIGNEIFNTDNVDNFVHKLIDRIGLTVFNSRVYQGSAPSILTSSWEYGSVLEKVDAEPQEAEESDSWNLQDGKSYDPNIFYQPKVSAKFFNSKVTFDIPLSFTQMQVKEAFNSASELNSFMTMLQTTVTNSLTVNLDSLIMKTLNNMTAQTLNSHKGLTVVNLLDGYNKTTGNTVTVDKALITPDFIKYANATINTYRDRLTKMSTLFNQGGKQKFTPTSEQHLIILSDLASSSKVYLESNTYNEQNVQLSDYDTVPYWQGSGTSYNFKDTSSIDVAIKDGSSTKEVKASGILGILLDTNSTMVACSNMRVTTNFNPKAEFYTNFTKYDASYLNDLNENYVVFVIQEPTTTEK